MKDKGTTDWISVVTNLGVMVGLLLVAYEVRQATKQAGADASQIFTSTASESRASLALSSELAEIVVTANESGIKTLTPVEIFRLSEWEGAKRMRMLGNIIQYRRGFLERGAIQAMLPSLIEAESGVWADLGMTPISREAWPEIKAIQDEMRLRDQ